jgi:hypothetical protein
MDRASFRRLTPIAAGAWAVLLATGLVAPSQARAGCTHPYVFSKTDTVVAVADLDLLAVGREAPEPSSRAPRNAPAPCSGPACSKLPIVPVSVPSVASPRLEQWCCLAAGSLSQASGSVAFPASERLLHPLHIASSLFHPPRLPE